MYCPKGVISLDPETAYYGLIGDDEYAIYTMYQADYSCNKQEVFATAIKNCENEKKCSIIFNNDWFDRSCLQSKSSELKLYMKMYCKKSELRLFDRTFTKE